VTAFLYHAYKDYVRGGSAKVAGGSLSDLSLSDLANIHTVADNADYKSTSSGTGWSE
jgi:hypothetical protein